MLSMRRILTLVSELNPTFGMQPCAVPTDNGSPRVRRFERRPRVNKSISSVSLTAFVRFRAVNGESVVD